MKLIKMTLLLMLSMNLIGMEKEQPRSLPKIDELNNLIINKDTQGIKKYLTQVYNPLSFLSQTVLIGGTIRTPLMLAIETNSPDIVKALIDSGADVNFTVADRLTTPLHLAVARKNPIIVNFLLAAGANPDKKSMDGSTALITAIINKAPHNIIDMLLDTGPNLDLQNSMGITALMAASFMGDIQTVHKLLEAGANPALKYGGNTALSIARQHGFAEIAKLIQDYLVLNLIKLQNE